MLRRVDFVVVLAVTVGALSLHANAKDKDELNKSAGSAETSVIEDKTNAEMLLGKWCGTQGNYTFTEKKLHVLRHSDRKNYDWDIVRMNFGSGWIELHFDESGKKNTVFNEFSKDGLVMHQAANTGGDMGPKMKFRRC